MLVAPGGGPLKLLPNRSQLGAGPVFVQVRKTVMGLAAAWALHSVYNQLGDTESGAQISSNGCMDLPRYQP
jgi:hypothetical protein